MVLHMTIVYLLDVYSCDVVHYCFLSVFWQLLIVSLQNFNNDKILAGQTAATFSLTKCCFSTFFLDLDIDVYCQQHEEKKDGPRAISYSTEVLQSTDGMLLF